MVLLMFFFFLVIGRPPVSTLFPYTTLFRSAPLLPVKNRRYQAGEYELFAGRRIDRKSTRLNSSHVSISYAVFCLKKKTLLLSRTASHPANAKQLLRSATSYPTGKAQRDRRP